MIAIGNHLWHCTLFAVFAALVALMLRSYQAKVRFWIWFVASAKFLLPFSLLINFGARTAHSPNTEQKVDVASASPVAIRVAQPFGREFTAVSEAQPDTTKREWAIAAIWFSGCLLIARKRYRDWQVLRSALQASSESPIAAEIEVRFSHTLIEPSVVGWRRPVLLLPDGIVDRLTGPQLRAVLTHEMFHARRKITCSLRSTCLLNSCSGFIRWCGGSERN